MKINNISITFFVFFILAISFNILSQQPAENLKNSVKTYYKQVNKAELNICQNNYKEAINEYKEAFGLLNSLFPKDIFNYIILNIDEGDYSEAFKFSESLVKLGAELKFFEQIPLKKLKTDTLRWAKFCNEFPKLRMDYLQKINFSLKQELEELTEADQENYRHKNFRPSNPVSEDSICNRLFQIITEYGYPNHDLIGLNIKDDTILMPLKHEIIIFHLFQTKNKNSDKIKDIIYEGVLNNKIEVVKSMNWLDYYYNYSFYGTRILYHEESNLYIESPNFEFNNYDFFNMNRNKINAATLEEEMLKVVYKFINSDSKFIINSLNHASANKLDSWLKKKSLIKIKIEDYKYIEYSKLFEKKIDLKTDLRNDSLEKYFQLINYAELSICKKDYQRACDLYEDAFEFNLDPFPKDINNCILANIYQNDISNAIKYCEKLIKIGFEPKFFEQMPFEKLRENKIWIKFLKKIYKAKNNYSSKIDIELKNNINDIIFNFTSNFISNVDANSDFSSIVDNKCYGQLISILKTRGYPGHKLVGTRVYNDTIIDKPEGILSVYYQTHSDLNELTNLLITEIYKGNLHPSEFLAIVKSTYVKDIIFGTPIICKDKENNYYTLNNENENVEKKMADYDNNRKNVFHNSINDELKKIIFMKKNSTLKFKFNVSEIKEIDNIEPYKVLDTYKKINLDDY